MNRSQLEVDSSRPSMKNDFTLSCLIYYVKHMYTWLENHCSKMYNNYVSKNTSKNVLDIVQVIAMRGKNISKMYTITQ